MIAEDEPPIMRAVKAAVEKADKEFVITKCCMNGREACDALSSEDFDIVITDIKMPMMTGIELAGWIYENKPETMVILLSGYQDFEYARKALEYKVFDYILKPVSKEKIKILLERVKAELNKSGAAQTISSGEKYTVVMLACAGTYLLHGSDVLMPGERIWADDMIEEIMRKTLLDSEEYVFFNTNVQSERIIVVSTENIERQKVIVNEFADNLKGLSPITIMYKTGVKFKDAGNSIPILREQLIKRIILGRTQLISCDDITESFENMANPYSKEEIEAVTSAIRKGQENDAKQNLKRILLSMRDSSCTQEEVMGLLNVILDTYTLNYPNKLKRKNSTVKRELVNAVAEFTSYDALIEDTASILMTLRGDEADSGRHGQLADEIEKYIKENFNKSITSETLSKEFGFVPSYICRIFKREKGVSPSEYITQYRIQVAKKALIDNPDMMIKEIADMTGFKEAYYFSKTFKRETGMWPTEFAGKH